MTNSYKQKSPERKPVSTAAACVICVRIAFAIVFVINVQCAVSFVLWPSHFVSAYELSGVAGNAAIRGIGVAFLMWNATYPAFVTNPRKFFPLGAIIISQQVIGLAGESFILATLPAQHVILASSITRFIAFDTSGLIIMAASFIWLLAKRKQGIRQTAHARPTCEQTLPKQARARTAIPHKQAGSPLASNKLTTNSQNEQEKDAL